MMVKRQAVLAAVVGVVALVGVARGQDASVPEAPVKSLVTVKDGVVQPKRPITEAIADAMTFFKKSDQGYVPGKLDGPLAGYFTSAHVLEDGQPSKRKFAFPARQHAYFIFT